MCFSEYAVNRAVGGSVDAVVGQALTDGKLPTQASTGHQLRQLSFEQRINAVLLTLDSTGPLK